MIKNKEMNVNLIFNSFKEKAKLLAKSYEEQYAELKELGDYITEDIANEWFDDDVLLLQDLANKGYVGNTVVVLCKLINNGFAEVSQHGVKYKSTIWTLDGLKNDLFWEQQRQLARKLLEELNKIKL